MEKKVFESAVVGGIKVKNRIVRSATHEGMAENGRVTPAILKMHQALAQGEVGLIITGYMAFSGSDHPKGETMSIMSDAVVPELKQLAENAHPHGAKIIVQLSHQGSQLFYKPNGTVFGPSDVVDPISGITPEPFSGEQIDTLIREFADAARRAQNAGFDGVQIHGAHGYLISKFLSPVYNRRTDEYGGTILGRARIALDILKEIKRVCGETFPVWIKLNSSDFDTNENGLNETDFMIIARALAENGIDAIEVSGGTMAGRHTPCRSRKHDAYHLESAKKLAEEIGVSVILVGGIRSFKGIETLLAETNISAVSMSRPLIREPGLVKRWLEGNFEDAACVACNGCFNPEGTVCYHNLPEEKKKHQRLIMQLFAPRD